MQLIVQEQELQPIDWNFEELKKELSSELEKYQNLVVVEEDLPKYKKDRATLNGLSAALDGERKRIKNKYIAPVAEFETKVKELIGLVKEPIDCLDDQLKKFEVKRKEEKRAKIEEKFNEINDIDQIKFSMVFEESWLNVSVSLKKISESITEYIEKVHADIQAITDLKSDFEEDLQKLYLKTFSLSGVLAKKNELDAIVAQAEAKKKAAEAAEAKRKEEAAIKEKERIEAEAKAKLDAINAEIEAKQKALENNQIEAVKSENQKSAESTMIIETFNSVKDANEDRPSKVEAFVGEKEIQLIQVDFRVHGTIEQLEALKKFLNENNITWGRA